MKAKEIIKNALKEAINSKFPEAISSSFDAGVGLPRESSHGDYSTNTALHLAKLAGKNPKEVAEILVKNISISSDIVEKIEIAGHGFINFFLSKKYLYKVIEETENQDKQYGSSIKGKGEKVQIEFVSANPTGPLNIVSARSAAVGDCISRLLVKIGYEVQKEFYINDAGNQVDLLGRSVAAKYKELSGEKTEFPENGYMGEYILDIANKIKQEDKQIKDLNYEEFIKAIKKTAIERILYEQKMSLKQFGVEFDNWFSEKSMFENNEVMNAIDVLEKSGYTSDKEGAKWFLATSFGDEKDRVLVKTDKTPAYLASDVAYHLNKFKRGFDKIIGILGPDHHGHIITMKAVIKALGLPADKFEFIIVQQVNLIENGKKVTMSKRAGKFITMDELVNEVGVDVARYFFLMRSCSSHMDFDLDLAKKQSDENPVYYLQYAHARICNILKYAEEQSFQKGQGDASYLTNNEEIDILKKIEIYPEILEISAISYSPHLLTRYLEELAGLFHRFYAEHRVVSSDITLTHARLRLVKAVKIVFGNGLQLLGVNAPEKM